MNLLKDIILKNEIEIIAVSEIKSKKLLDQLNDENNNKLCSQDLISYCARVSNPNNQENFESADRLLMYCLNKQHWSIFEMVNVVIEINTTRDIARQILRHRSFSFQEFSQRYADPTEALGFDIKEPRLQDTKNRQNSIPLNLEDPEHQHINDVWRNDQEWIIEMARQIYKKAISMGIAKEQARAILPEGLTMSRMYVNGTLRSWIHYCTLRMQPGTQEEHRLIAAMIWKELVKEFRFLENY